MNRVWRRPFPQAPLPTVTRLLVVGDVHDRAADQWTDRDFLAVKALKPDMTLFVGDIGNENVDAVQRIAQLDTPKAVILGNHDAFYTAEPLVRATLDRGSGVDTVNAQLDALGDDHVGFGVRLVPNKPVSIVGARPFSWGGRVRNAKLIRNLYGYAGIPEFSNVIVQNALEVPRNQAVVVMGHNGPTELGNRRHDICGVDFRSKEGDHGDEDLRLALDRLSDLNRSPALVTFGHMHHRLRPHNGRVEFRRRLVYDAENEMLFLNVAVVPRVESVESDNGTSPLSRHHFCLVEIEAGRVTKAEDVWVTLTTGAVMGELQGMTLFERHERDGGHHVRLWNTHSAEWEEHDLGKRITNDYVMGTSVRQDVDIDFVS